MKLKNIILACKLGFVVSILGLCVSTAQSTPDTLDIYSEMDLDTLLSLPIGIGTLDESGVDRTPASVTIITEREIAATPARTILDLLEVYVPGMTYVQHFNGPRLGMRGMLGDQNHSFSMLVNGRNVGLSTGDGFSSEILMRDLHDIERIEIIRGPGSVTHGPGSIAGTINIVTHTAASSPGLRAGVSADARYRYETIYGSYGYRSPNLDLYLYGSYGRSRGDEDTEFFYVDRAHGYGYGFIGPDWGNNDLGTPAPNMYEDFRDKPQVKLHLDAQIGDNLVAWARYTTYSSTKLLQDGSYTDGFYPRGEFEKTFTAWVEHDVELSENHHLETSFGFDGVSRRNVMGGGARTHNDPLNVTESYSENQLLARLLLVGSLKDSITYALGTEVSYEFWKPEWGHDDDTFLMRFRSPIGPAVIDASSPHWSAYGDSGRYSLLSDDLDATTLSVFGTGSADITDTLTLMLSARADKHQYAKLAYSPRVALLKDLTPNDSLKLIVQRSVRLPSFTDMYSEHVISGKDVDPEIMEGCEVVYARRLSDSLNLDVATFYSTVDQIAWASTGQNEVIGNLDLWGAEAEIYHSGKRHTSGLSYSYVEQLDWDPNVEAQANLVNLDGGPMPVEDFADNRLNNLPNQTLKAYTTIRLSRGIVWHTNARMMWDYGQNDMLDMFTDAHEQYGTDASRAEMTAIRDALRHYGYGKASFTLNTQVQWTLPITDVDASLSLYAMNLLQHNNIRYVIQYWEADLQYPRQCGFVEEPLSVGVQFNVRF